MPPVPSASLPIALVAAMRPELAPLRQRAEIHTRRAVEGLDVEEGTLGSIPVVLARTGIGPKRARKALRRLLAHVPVSAVVMVGTAGGLSPDLRPGTLVRAAALRDAEGVAPPPDVRLAATPLTGRVRDVVPVTLVTVAAPVLAPADKAVLRATCPPERAAAVDMESATGARVAADFGVPFLVLRVISDAADERLPPFLLGCFRPDGTLDPARLRRAVGRRPWRVFRLLALQRRLTRCTRRLARAVEALLPHLAEEVRRASPS